jgi:anti-sigma factor RsiW
MSREALEADLSAYIDGALDEARAAEVAAALATDPELRALEARLRQSAELLRGLPSPDASPRLRAAVLDAVAQPTWRERLATWLTPPRLGLALAGSLAAVALWWAARPADGSLGSDAERLLVAQHLELLEDYDMVGLDDAADLEVIAALDDLEVVR